MQRIDTLGNRLLSVMEERQLSYEQLGRLLDRKPQTLNRYVLGQREPKATVAVELAMKLQLNPLWLIGYDVPKTCQTSTPQESTPSESPETLQPPTPPPLAQCPIWDSMSAAYSAPFSPLDKGSLGTMSSDAPNPEQCFYWRVSDSGSIGDGIRAGDLLLMQRQARCSNGQLVLCTINGSSPALKRWYYQGSWAVLQPIEYSGAPEIVPLSSLDKGETQILGVAVKLIRQKL